jgi:hypothetical protein
MRTGQHVATLFVQYAPYALDSKVGNWADERFKHAYADRILRIIDEKAPGFSNSIIGQPHTGRHATGHLSCRCTPTELCLLNESPITASQDIQPFHDLLGFRS